MFFLMGMIAYFMGGIFFTNAVPHLVSAALGRPFQTPFAKPRGVGLSSSLANAIWGFGNLVAGYLLVFQVGQFDVRAAKDALPLGAGILIGSILSALIFGRLYGGDLSERP